MEKRWIYEMFSEEKQEEEGVRYVTYGIRIRMSYTFMGEYVRSVSDLCLDRGRMETLCEQCGRLQLDPIHLDEVIEDFLGADLGEDL